MNQWKRGRGNRGRGNGNGVPTNDSAWKPPDQKTAARPSNQKTQTSNNSGGRKFEEACREINESVQRYMATHQLSEDQDNDDDDEEELEEDKVLARVLDKYDENDKLGRTHQFLQDAFKKGALVCLICIENIKRTDHIWSCSKCSTSFHIPCVQKWAKDSLFLQAETLEQKGQFVDKKTLRWCCPKCRGDYAQIKVPTNYYCFCGKKKDPEFDPWLIPHSCGDICNKPLQPDCGHSCLLLCHPGPCPPCPKTVSIKCHCGAKLPQTRRCSSKFWSCGGPCGRLLGCGQHPCQTPCHEGPCPPCPRRSKQHCMCGAATQLRACAEPQWNCNKVCGRQYSCGYHTCEKVCHSGSCNSCPSSGERTCPCGKTVHQLPCTAPVPTCGDTCNKPLTCGMHLCTERCHKGPCPSCLQFLVKPCRCGTRAKEMACSKEFTCDSKCKKMRDCGRHQCNKKCCLGECPLCESQCGRTLGCNNHKCESRCHPGRCYPCPKTFTVACPCEATAITVPCGRERTIKPPKCSKLCSLPTECHHEVRKKHKCHSGRCPQCNFLCDLRLSCGHKCPQPCHDGVPVKVVDQRKRAGPWEKATATYIEIQKKPCPPCLTPVPTTCRGNHETPNWPCSDLRPYSCGRKCGRKLSCSNHNCENECHVVQGANDEHLAGINCSPCERQCTKTRPIGCPHECNKTCHVGDCPECRQRIRLKCHCTISQVYVECNVLINATENSKERLLCCSNQCNKLISCGHWCQKECHSGGCSKTQDCKKRVALRCPCKRIKKDFLCHLNNSNKALLNCDDICLKKIEEKKKEIEDEKRLKKELEVSKQKKELEEFERKMVGKKGKRPRNRRQTENEQETSFLQKRKYFIIAFLLLIVSIVLYFMLIH